MVYSSRMPAHERRTAVPTDDYAPRYVVWELTLRCDLACTHCGSRAGRPRHEELDIDELRDVARQLGEMGTRECVVIGGEAYLHPRWLDVVAALHEQGIRVLMTTGGRGLTAERAQQGKAAGLSQVSLSIDGLRETHDTLRNLRGSFDAALRAIGHARDAGLEVTANTQFNRLNLPEVEALADVLIEAGVSAWQVQITGPMGRAADMAERLLQPYDLLELVPRVAAVARRARERGVAVTAANNLGYFGPYEAELRSGHFFQGCIAGRYGLGIESNGDIKGCPSLPSEPYIGGNVREASLADIWEHREELRFARDRTEDELWGHCKGCYYASVCRGGCSWTAHTLLGRRGNMPYCYHRADILRAKGIREVVRPAEAAPGRPFDFGRFELSEEPFADSH